MTIEADVQNLEPGKLIDLWELDATEIGGGLLRFQAISDAPVMWQGVEYSPWPMKAEGFGKDSGQQPTPTVSVANIDGSISLLCIAFEDMVGSVVIRHRTFGKYLDGQPEADPTQEFPLENWFIERKVSEDTEAVTFELASPLDFGDMYLPARQIIANFCPHVYRGEGCNYTGIPVADANDVPTSDPGLDDCGKRPGSCKLRDWPDDILNYGGFIAAGLTRT
jgi:lambda family phage minor tail protein L